MLLRNPRDREQFSKRVCDRPLAVGKTTRLFAHAAACAFLNSGRRCSKLFDCNDDGVKGHNQCGVPMRTVAVITIAVGVLSGLLVAQEKKPVPKDSVRVFVPGCTKGFIFTAGRRTEDEPGSVDIPQGMHLRMNGPKKMMAEIKAHEGSMIEITGLMRKGQYKPDGVRIGGVRITPGRAPTDGSLPGDP